MIYTENLFQKYVEKENCVLYSKNSDQTKLRKKKCRYFGEDLNSPVKKNIECQSDENFNWENRDNFYIKNDNKETFTIGFTRNLKENSHENFTQDLNEKIFKEESINNLCKDFKKESINNLRKEFKEESINNLCKEFKEESINNLCKEFKKESINNLRKEFKKESINNLRKDFKKESINNLRKDFKKESINNLRKEFKEESINNLCKDFKLNHKSDYKINFYKEFNSNYIAGLYCNYRDSNAGLYYNSGEKERKYMKNDVIEKKPNGTTEVSKKKLEEAHCRNYMGHLYKKNKEDDFFERKDEMVRRNGCPNIGDNYNPIGSWSSGKSFSIKHSFDSLNMENYFKRDETMAENNLVFSVRNFSSDVIDSNFSQCNSNSIFLCVLFINLFKHVALTKTFSGIFRKFVAFVPNTLVGGFIYFKRGFKNFKNILYDMESFINVYFICCILFKKYTSDTRILNIDMVEYIEINIKEFNYLEALVSNSLEYNLHITKDEYMSAMQFT